MTKKTMALTAVMVAATIGFFMRPSSAQEVITPPAATPDLDYEIVISESLGGIAGEILTNTIEEVIQENVENIPEEPALDGVAGEIITDAITGVIEETVKPTATPKPTEKPAQIPAPTAKPVEPAAPVQTPAPTATPEPTPVATPAPVVTPEPTPMATPEPTPVVPGVRQEESFIEINGVTYKTITTIETHPDGTVTSSTILVPMDAPVEEPEATSAPVETPEPTPEIPVVSEPVVEEIPFEEAPVEAPVVEEAPREEVVFTETISFVVTDEAISGVVIPAKDAE